MAETAGRIPPGAENPNEQPPVRNEMRPVPKGNPPRYLTQPGDPMMEEKHDDMGPLGPWASGRLDWRPTTGTTGIRPVVDKYSITKYSEVEWRKRNSELIDMALEGDKDANLCDWNSRKCIEQTRADVDKNQEDNTKRLNQREQDIHRWKCELEMAVAALYEEICLLEEQRKRLKAAGAILNIPESIVGECLERRTGRLDSDLIRDEVEEELIKESALVAEIRQIFSATLKDIETQLSENKTAKQRLEYDWSDKVVAHKIEGINCGLNNKSKIIMFKHASVAFPYEQSTEEHWENFTRETLREAEATRQRSVTLRATLDTILTNASRDLRCQADKVETSLSQRLECNDQIKIKLENELKKILQRLANVEDVIRDLQAAIQRMDIPMKKAQTRLDNRLVRPRVENCRDTVHFGLIEEVKIIGENVSALKAQLNTTVKNQDELIEIRNKLEKEIFIKKNSLEIDRARIQLLRSHYPSASELSGYSTLL
ncbi:hypothetical protein PPYR_09248 [Photinus pyralis]|uniref:Tektin n=1 Tax=Photinus pyralis TaxID=7054 RepID=A0A5N4ALM1_PHOPY|nr:tektin-4-like [Photinus pyralis]KAB0798255.1 hypothetical protein PPYR_09248 [Photinus pyralis]